MSDLGIDLGTLHTRVVVQGRGVIARVPTLVAAGHGSPPVPGAGNDVRDPLDPARGKAVAVQPVRSGVIADRDAATSLLSRLIADAVGPRCPRVLLSVPAVTTAVARRWASGVALAAGARRVILLPSPVAAALGAGMELDGARATFVVDVGAGTTDVAVVSFGWAVLARTIPVAGLAFDDAVAGRVREDHRVVISRRASERVKVAVGTLAADQDRGSIALNGRDLLAGLPRALEIDSATVRLALQEPLRAIVRAIRDVFDETPPELAADLATTGVLLTGGGSLIPGFDRALQEQLDLPVAYADDPPETVASGLERALALWPELERREPPATSR